MKNAKNTLIIIPSPKPTGWPAVPASNLGELYQLTEQANLHMTRRAGLRALPALKQESTGNPEALSSGLMKVSRTQGTVMQGTTHLMLKSQQESSSSSIKFPGFPCLTRSPLPKSNGNNNPRVWKP